MPDHVVELIKSHEISMNQEQLERRDAMVKAGLTRMLQECQDDLWHKHAH